jgi:hypothetical protein
VDEPMAMPKISRGPMLKSVQSTYNKMSGSLRWLITTLSHLQIHVTPFAFEHYAGSMCGATIGVGGQSTQGELVNVNFVFVPPLSRKNFNAVFAATPTFLCAMQTHHILVISPN